MENGLGNSYDFKVFFKSLIDAGGTPWNKVYTASKEEYFMKVPG